MDRNESIHLWLLEEDRKKRRAHISEMNDQGPANQHRTIAYQPSFERRTVSAGENKQQTFISADLEQLLKKKADLEAELHRLDDQQRILDAQAEFLCGKIIQEIRKQNQEKEQAVYHLHERITEMETQLGQSNEEES
jgi:hypothetical protein